MKEFSFTTLAELKGFLNALTEEELIAQTNIHDWYVIEVVPSRLGGPVTGFHEDRMYYSIEGKDGGEE